MLFTELADYPLPSGVLTDWTPTAQHDSFVPDPRRINAPHEHYLGAHASWLGGVLRLNLRLDEAVLAKALTDWVDRHEAMRTTVREHHGSIARYTAPTGSVGWKTTGSKIMPDTKAIHAHLVSTFDTVLNPHAWPHCRFATISGSLASPEDSFTLIFAADHSVMDAYSLLNTITEVEQLYRARLHDLDHGLEPVGSYLDFSDTDRAFTDEVTADHPTVVRWEEFFARSGGDFPPFPMSLTTPDHDSTQPQSGLGFRVMSNEQIDEIGAACRHLGYSLQTAIMAAIATATARLTGQEKLVCAMPMHLRNRPDLVAAAGWFIGIAPIEVDLSTAQGESELERALAAAAAGLAANKNLSHVPLVRVAELLGRQPRPRFAVSYIDCRFTPGVTEWDSWQAHTLRSDAFADDEVYLWVARVAGGLTLSARFPSNRVAAAAVHDLIREMTSVLSEFVQVAATASAAVA